MAAVRHRLRHLLFEALYDRLAPVYDGISRLAFAGEWVRWGEVAVRFVGPAPIVELGCGTGLLQATLGRAGAAALGVDLALPMVRQAARRAPGRIARARVQRLPFRSGSIGTLVSVFPTAYILDEATWHEAERVLMPGGRVVVIDHGWLAPDGPYRRLLLGLHGLVYGLAGGPPPPLPTGRLPAISLIERTAHGWVSVTIATRQSPVASGQSPVGGE